MKITMLNYTGMGLGSWEAANLLIFTKNTRLQMKPGLLNEIRDWPEKKKLEELEYMSNTIPSSWEFVDYTFLIENVTRAFTHQIVRTRTNSYAQQTMRVLDVSGFTYKTGQSIIENERAHTIYGECMDDLNRTYKELISSGVKIEDARGVLPTNIHTNIVVKMNMRTAAETVCKRTSIRTQGEYRDFVFAITEKILEVHPWAKCFLRNRKLDACNKLEQFVRDIYTPSRDPLKVNILDIIKLIDILRD